MIVGRVISIFTQTDAIPHRQGTPAFMPVEILDNIYYFRPKRTATYTGLSRVAELLEGLKQRPTRERKPEIMRHNYLHDIESLWWIALYGLLTTVPTGDRETKAKAAKKRLDYAKAIFRNRLQCSNERRALFLEREELEMLNRGRVPDGYEPVARYVVAAADLLAEAFCAFEADMGSHDSAEFGHVHEGMQCLFKESAFVAVRETTVLPGWE